MEKNQMKINRSFLSGDLRASVSETGEEGIIEGYAIKFNEITKIGNYFTESITQGAIDEDTLRDVLFLTNHNSDRIPLARSRRNNKNSSLQLKIDEVGLFFKAILDIKNNPSAQELYSAVKRGDITGMSFWMKVQSDTWSKLDSDLPHREINMISQIPEISAVNWPAYEGTEINARSNPDSLENDKIALDNAKSVTVETEQQLEMRKKVLLFKVKNKIRR